VYYWYPWTHIIGGTLTYNDDEYTGLIYRVEQSISTKEPRNRIPPGPDAGPRAGQVPNATDLATEGKTDTMVWRSMIGFDYLKRFQWMPWFLGKDQWLVSAQLLTEYYASVAGQMGLTDSVTDRMQHWNNTATYFMTGYFAGGKFRPQLAAGYDFNAKFPIVWLQGEYHLTHQLSVRAGEILYMGSRLAESHLFLNKYADRDETYVRFTWYLL
jgi:hypothetical protein